MVGKQHSSKAGVSKQSYVIALDAMGGDKAPDMIIKGVNIAAERHPNVQFLLFGDEKKLLPLVSRCRRVQRCATIVHTPHAIASQMKAADALRAAGRQSSMRLAIQAVKDGEAHAVISAGNTGALMALSKVLLGMIPGIKRPAITSLFPTRTGESVMLDLGANIECDAENLVQFAFMGHVFARTVFAWDTPSVGLLNVGAEHQKGKASIQDAAKILAEDYTDINFKGFIEGNDIAAGKVDVIVTDGFTGNIALKTAEGTANLISEFTRQTFRYSWGAKLGFLLARRAFNKLKMRIDPRRYNGAVFLGLNAVSIKSHGGTDAVGFAAAIDVAVDMLRQDCLGAMRQMAAHANVVADASVGVDASLVAAEG